MDSFLTPSLTRLGDDILLLSRTQKLRFEATERLPSEERKREDVSHPTGEVKALNKRQKPKYIKENYHMLLTATLAQLEVTTYS